MTQTAAPDTIKLEKADNQADTYTLVHSQTNAPVGTLKHPETSSLKVRPYLGKGGMSVIVSSKDSGLRYFVLPGGKLSIGKTTLTLSGEDIPKQNSMAMRPLFAERPLDASIQTMILGAGLATRFEPVSGENTGYSKPAVPLLGSLSVIEAIASGLHRSGFGHLFVNTYFKPASIKNSLANSAQSKAKQLTYIDEPAPSGTAGALRKLLQAPEKYGFDTTKPMLLVQGDAVTDVDFSSIYDAHKANNALVTIGCMSVPENQVSQFGIIVTDKSNHDGVSGRIQQFQEKPKQGDHLSTLANTGFYLFSPEAYPIILDVYKQMGKQGDEELDFAKNIFPEVLKRATSGNPFWAQQIDSTSYWNDIGNPRQYLETVHDIFHGKVRLPLPEQCSDFFEQGILYWPTAKEKATKEGAQLTGNVIVAVPFES